MYGIVCTLYIMTVQVPYQHNRYKFNLPVRCHSGGSCYHLCSQLSANRRQSLYIHVLYLYCFVWFCVFAEALLSNYSTYL